ncbi:MAG: YeeE/YedE family protein [Chlamydiae bacterium]|nr:YeeE/YedE family protein [Chlamydiota bacterium]
MINFLRKDRWSPYVAGALIGALSWVAFVIFNHSLGTAGGFTKITAFLGSLASVEHVKSSEYFSKYYMQTFGWQVTFILGVFFGSLIAVYLSKKKRVEYVPELWKKNFGPSKVKRFIGAYIGGIFLMFGARLAGGCMSGHGISGGLQLSISGWIFIICGFGTAIATAFMVYRKH